MSLDTCIPGLVENGEITAERGRRINELYGKMLDFYRGQMGEAAAAAAATERTLEQLVSEAAQKKRVRGLQIAAQQRMVADMAKFKGAGEGPIKPAAALALFDRDGRAGYSNVEARRKAVRGRAHAMIDGILADHSAGISGKVRKRAQLEDIVRELFGEHSGNENAKELANAWSNAAEMLRQRFNAAGGHIGKMEGWGLPQSHDWRSVRAAGFERWRDEVLPKLDRDKMLDPETGQPFTPAGMQQALRGVWETIRSEGWDDRTPGGQGIASMANRRSDPRFLIFKSADDWMAYQRLFGAGTAFDAMMGHIDGMSRDIALMEILGPNPAASVRWLKDTLRKSAADDEAPDSKAIDQAGAGGRNIDRLYAEIAGTHGGPESRKLALAFSSIRSMQTAAKLGGAALSAVTDTAFQSATRHLNGLRQATMIRDYVKLFRPGAEADQRLAVRLGLVATEWSHRTAAQGRFLNEELTGEVSRRLAEGVLRLSGLSRWTEAGRWAFGMEFLGHITDESVKRFDGLDPAFRRALQRYGIDEPAWEAIRHTPLEIDRGVPWLKPQNVENRELGDKLLEMIATETDFAVPTADLRTRAMFNSVAPRGTWIGEIMRSALLFKSFGVSMLLMQGRRIMEQAGTNAATYAAGLLITSTLAGGLAMQLKALAAGEDPRAMDNPEFWGAAILQGGGFGIFGDFLQSAQNRFGGGFAETAAGPLVSDAQDISNMFRSKHPAWQAVRQARAELPGGSLWYARLAFDRMVTDQIQQEMDPNYRQSWQRMEKRARDQRTQYWWRSGQMLPDRAPDMSNVNPG